MSVDLKSWASAIGVVGIPGVIAIFLVYIGATEIPKLVRVVDASVIETRLTRDLLRQHMDQMDRLILMMQRTCSNTAKDDTARQRCFDP